MTTTVTLRALVISGGKVARRSSKRVFVAKSDHMKTDLVRDTDFVGLLAHPQIKKLNCQFSAWLMNMIDCAVRTVLSPDNMKITISDVDVERVMGIPCESKTETGLEDNISDEGRFHVRQRATIHGGVEGSYRDNMQQLQGKAVSWRDGVVQDSICSFCCLTNAGTKQQERNWL